MRYRIAAVGKLKRRFYRDGCRHYLERLEGLARVEVIEVKEARGAGAAKVQEVEATALLGQVHGRLVTLDEHGRSFRSKQLAQHLTALELEAHSTLTLVIGGAEGLGEPLRKAAHESWSLSPLTLPHDLARLLLLEQLYRAETIRSGHPYHRE